MFRSISVSVWSRKSLNRFYSSAVSSSARSKWRLAGLSPPQSILDDSDDPVDLSEDSDIVNGARPDTPPSHRRIPPQKPTPTEYAKHHDAMKKEFPQGWNPPRKLSREAMDGLRELHHFDKATFTTPVLAEKFKISPEAVRRILKSKWEPSREQKAKYAQRDRANREQSIKLNRLRERLEAKSVIGSTGYKNGQINGVKTGMKDFLTLQ